MIPENDAVNVKFFLEEILKISAKTTRTAKNLQTVSVTRWLDYLQYLAIYHNEI